MKKYIAEIIGTFSMIFCGCGAMVINDFTGGIITHPGVAITWGLIVMSMIYAFGDISGAHFNPAVTIGFAVAKKFSWNEVPKYIGAQFSGAMLASLVLLFLFPLHLSLQISDFIFQFNHFKFPANSKLIKLFQLCIFPGGDIPGHTQNLFGSLKPPG